jgi:hypothetical protein
MLAHWGDDFARTPAHAENVRRRAILINGSIAAF